MLDLHNKMNLNYAVIQGMIKPVLFSDGKYLSINGNLVELFVGKDNHCIVKIPPKNWIGFKEIENEQGILANCTTLPYNPNDRIQYLPFTNRFSIGGF